MFITALFITRREGRLRPEDRNCNFVPKQLAPAQLQKGYWDW